MKLTNLLIMGIISLLLISVMGFAVIADDECVDDSDCDEDEVCDNGECEDVDEEDDNEPKGYAFGYRFKLEDLNMTFKEFKAEIRAKFENKTEENGEFKVKLSNGKYSEIKIMPNVANERALERLRIKVCSEENNCQIELKEVGKGGELRPAYEVQAERHAKLLGLFRLKMLKKAEIDAETGEIIRVKKPWWAFLAVEEEE